MSDFATMLLVLGGTFVVGAALLYLSMRPAVRLSPGSKRDAAVETTAAMIAAQDSGSSDRA
ncbi:MAG: hypothetical protein ABW006_06710 [Hyphomicrobium sp.]